MCLISSSSNISISVMFDEFPYIKFSYVMIQKLMALAQYNHIYLKRYRAVVCVKDPDNKPNNVLFPDPLGPVKIV